MSKIEMPVNLNQLVKIYCPIKKFLNKSPLYSVRNYHEKGRYVGFSAERELFKDTKQLIINYEDNILDHILFYMNTKTNEKRLDFVVNNMPT